MGDTNDVQNRLDEYDVVIIGGGPAGCSAAVFTARYGLDTVVFDRGTSSLRRCAVLENYLGFPAGIDIDTFYELMHRQVVEAGGELVTQMVETVSQVGDRSGFFVESRDGQSVKASTVIAATRHGAEYLRELGDESMFQNVESHGEKRVRFDPDYADSDGRTPVDGLYIASPAGRRSDQAIIAAGHGAHVAHCLLQDQRSNRGFPDFVAPHYDWLRRDTEFSGEWGDRDRWRKWFDDQCADDPDTAKEELNVIREEYIDQTLRTGLTDQEREERVDGGYDQLLDCIPDERIREHLDRIEQ